MAMLILISTIESNLLVRLRRFGGKVVLVDDVPYVRIDEISYEDACRELNDDA